MFYITDIFVFSIQASSNCQNPHRSRCILHFRTSVLRLLRNRVERNQRSFQQERPPVQLHPENRARYHCCADRHRCSNYRSIYGSHRCLLLFDTGTAVPGCHWDSHLLGSGIRSVLLENLEEYSRYNFRSSSTCFRHAIGYKRYS